MRDREKIESTEEAWDARKLGAEEEFVRAVDLNEDEIDSALELQLISIRLQKSLIEDFKIIAKFNGLGYQPLMRQVLSRFADAEKRRILNQVAVENEENLDKEEDCSDAQANCA